MHRMIRCASRGPGSVKTSSIEIASSPTAGDRGRAAEQPVEPVDEVGRVAGAEDEDRDDRGAGPVDQVELDHRPDERELAWQSWCRTGRGC
jgi:hypothetical protein